MKAKYIPRIDLHGHGSMDFELYRKIIDSLGQFKDPIKVIRLYKEGEPLLNPRFAEMVRYAKESGYCLKVDTTINASLLTPKRSLEIIDAAVIPACLSTIPMPTSGT